jgi:DNA-binding NarL/FixJ family response regulator
MRCVDCARGFLPLSAPVAIRMMEFFSAPALQESSHCPLTGREREVLTLIAQGMNVSDVASLLSISIHTVRGYVKDIYRKLGISSRAEASLRASKMGLISD